MTIRLRPSASHRWTKCAAFPSFAARLPAQPETDAAREGTCAAWVAEDVLLGLMTLDEMIGQSHDNGWLVDDDMVSDLRSYVEHIRSRPGTICVESLVKFSDEPLIEGTPDASVHVIVDKTLYVTDLKYGYNIVEVFENPQLLIYAYALLIKLPPKSVDKICLEIYQPRAYHHLGVLRKWTISLEELNKHANDIYAAALKCFYTVPDATPGGHCVYCPAATRCEALAHTTYALAMTIMSNNERDMRIEELSRELTFMSTARKIIEARFKAVEDEATARIKNHNIPGWRIVSSTGHRMFTCDPVTLQALTGVDPYNKKIITPKEAERRGADEATVKKLSVKPQIGHKLARVTAHEIAELFGGK